MALHDTVFVHCPECKKSAKIQTKAGPCNLMNYSCRKVPLSIAEDLNDTSLTCEHCNLTFTLVCPVPYVRMEIDHNN